MFRNSSGHTLNGVESHFSRGDPDLFTFLVITLLAKVDDDLCCSGVERVEVGPMLAIQALHREVVDAA